MSYKLLLVDLDGTLAPDLGMPPREFTPSEQLQEAINAAKNVISVCLCTGRDKETVMKVSRALQLTTPHIIEGGAKIIDTKGHIVWVQYMNTSSTLKILKILKGIHNSFSAIVDGVEVVDSAPTENFGKVTAILLYDMTDTQVQDLKKSFSSCTDIYMAVNADRNSKNTLYITHKNGTKAHGIEKLQGILRVSKEETIGVGDGKNDYPLLISSGLKIAMGNGVAELKGIADYIAPSVQEDGIVDVLQKFVLR